MELDIKIKNGSLDIASSGIILIDGTKPTTFTIKDNGNPMDIVITFKNDEANPKELKRSTKPIEGKNAFEIEFTNYNSVLGSYTKEPWLIGTSFNRKLYISYLISGFTQSDMKKFEYSFYLGEGENNG